MYYDGVNYSTIKEFTKKFGLPYQQTVNKLNAGYTPEQIINGEKKSDFKPNLRNIAINFGGKEYASLRQFCIENELSYSRIYNLQRKGYSIEEIAEIEPFEIKQQLEEGPYSICNMALGTRKIFEDNPYCVLGIKCNSTRKEALAARDKLEKLNRLGAVITYKSEYDLNGVEKPNRDLGHIQVVLNNLNKIEYRWLWFLDSSYVSLWQEELIFENYDDMDFKYDLFLACYLNALITDACFTNREKWRKIFGMIDKLFDMPGNEMYKFLSLRLIETERLKYNYRMAVENFKETIQTPIFTTLETADGKVLLNVIEIVTDAKGGIQKNLKERINGLVLKWVEDCLAETKGLINSINAIKNLNNASATEANNMYRCLHKLEKNCFRIAEIISRKLDELYSEMIMDCIKGVVYDATIALTAGGRKKDACHFDSMIYIYCTEKQKSEIMRVYPSEWLEIPDSEYTVEECRRIAGKFEAEKDWKNGFIWMMKAAQKGDADSQNDIGVYFALGRGRQVNAKVAAEWFEKAAKGGCAVAYSNLAYRYYDGMSPYNCDREKAKEYWIRAYKIDRGGKYKEILDEKFPDWKYTKHPLLTFSEKDWRYRIKPYAEDEICDAQYRYGMLLYYGINGCSMDKNAARRWLLRAAIYNHPLAIQSLKSLYGIDAVEATSGAAMDSQGLKYVSDKTDQGEDLRFYWFYKAVVNKHDEAINRLGVCYSNGTGTDRNVQEANKYFLMAIDKGSDWAMYNYAYNLFYGNGVAANKEKCKELMIRSRDKGNESAKSFLKENFGITNEYREFTYSNLTEDVTINNTGIRIDFCGLENSSGKTSFKFWISNNNGATHQIWIKKVKLNGEGVGSITSLGVFENGKYGYSTKSFDFIQQNRVDYIEFQIEVDDEGTTELFTIDTVKITLYNNIHSISCEQIKGTRTASDYSFSIEDDEDNGNPYDFACEDFEDVMIYDDGNIRIEFGGFEVNEDKVYAKIWSKNTSKNTYRLWAKDIVVDDDQVSEYEEVTTSMPDDSWESNNLLVDGVDLEVYYDVDLTIEIRDEKNKRIALSKRVESRIDFASREIDVELSEQRDNEEDADTREDEDEVLNRDSKLYVENSFCMKSTEHNGLELYFPAIPSEFIRATLKEQGWRWHRQKGCWYVKNNVDNYDLALKITGNNVKG